MFLTQSIRRAAQVRPHAVAHIDEAEELTWPQFVARVAAVAGALSEGGLHPGARVAIMGLNGRRYLEAHYAVWWAGGVVVPVNTRWSHAENLYALRDAEARVLMFDEHFVEAAEGLFAGGLALDRRIYLGPGRRAGAECFEDLAGRAPLVVSREVAGGDLAAIYYTGGTTGFSKGVMLSPLALWTNALSTALEWKLDEAVRYLHAAPMFHLADGCMSLATTAVAAAHVYVPSFRPAAVLESVDRHQVTHTLLVPTMIGMLLDELERAPRTASSLRAIGYGASPIPEATLERALRQLPECALGQAYGQTELSPVATFLSGAQHVSGSPRLRTAGRATYAAEVKIADAHGAELARGEVGEVWVRGTGVMLGYWRKPEETAAALVDGWVRTGDAALMDADGYVQICDRLKDMIISGGENVYSAEVENAIASHHDVAAVSVIGVPDPKLGERVHAVIVPKGDAAPSLETIYQHTRALIAGYKCPRSIELRGEPLPLSAAGKVLKSALRAPHWEGATRQVN